MRTRPNKLLRLLQAFLLPAAVLLILICFTFALNSLETGRQAESLQQLEAALRRASVACYAVEGVYPPNLDYLQEHYGIQINEVKYIVHYDVFAENLMPDITVLENTQ